MQHSIAHAISFATIAWVLHQPQRGVHRGVLLNDLNRVIAGAIVYDDNFSIPATLDGVLQNSIQRCSNAGALVICGNDDAERAVVSRWSLVVGQGLQAGLCSRHPLE